MEDWPWNVDSKRDGQCPDVLSCRETWKKCGGLWANGVAPTVVTVGARAFAHNNLKLYDDFYYEMCYCTYTVIDISGFYMVLYLLFQGFSLPWINTVNSTAWSSSSFLNPAWFGLGCNNWLPDVRIEWWWRGDFAGSWRWQRRRWRDVAGESGYGCPECSCFWRRDVATQLSATMKWSGVAFTSLKHGESWCDGPVTWWAGQQVGDSQWQCWWNWSELAIEFRK